MDRMLRLRPINIRKNLEARTFDSFLLIIALLALVALDVFSRPNQQPRYGCRDDFDMYPRSSTFRRRWRVQMAIIIPKSIPKSKSSVDISICFHIEDGVIFFCGLVHSSIRTDQVRLHRNTWAARSPATYFSHS